MRRAGIGLLMAGGALATVSLSMLVVLVARQLRLRELERQLADLARSASLSLAFDGQVNPECALRVTF